MTAKGINKLLFLAIIVMAMLPLAASLYFANTVLDTSLNIGFNADVSEVLDDSAANLKQLAHLDDKNHDKYRNEFDQVQNLRMIYGSRDFVSKSIRHTLLICFAIGAGTALVVAIVLAAFLSRKISDSYRIAHLQLAEQSEKIRYLEEISSWQELARILAHEIKNPLTPIEMLMSSLTRSYAEMPAERFAEFITQTQKVTLEEIMQLKNTVQKFSSFAHLPSIQMVPMDVCATLVKMVESINDTATNARVVFAKPCSQNDVFFNLDVTLFRQILNNLVNNGIEANPDAVVIFSVSVHFTEEVVRIDVMNDGIPVAPTIVPRMFDPYISSKRGNSNAGHNPGQYNSHSMGHNMGLGLAIVRKIMLEHGGDIRYEACNGFPKFVLTLPRIDSHD